MLIRDYRDTPEQARGSVLAIGNFDGLHPGHIAVLQEALRQAAQRDAVPAVMSFAPHPRRFFNPSLPPLKLMRLADKMRALQRMGFKHHFLQRFDTGFAGLSADRFGADILAKHLGVRHVVTGEDFTYGAGRSGNAETLRDAGRCYGFGTSAIAPITIDGVVCSSSRIREALAAGDPAQAARLLGHPFALTGHVTHGDKRGRTLGFPTANIPLAGLFLPKFGVYAVEVTRANGRLQQGVANLGVRPTVGGTRPQLEVHLWDETREFYGEKVSVTLHMFLRPEQAFSGLDALKAQIAVDSAQAKTYFSDRKP